MLKIAKVVALNSDSEAAIAYAGKNLASTSLFVLVTASLEDAFSKTKQSLAEAEDLFVSSQSALSQKLSEVLEYIKDSLKEASELQILVGAAVENAGSKSFYLQSFGEELGAYLVRGGSKSNFYELGLAGQLISGFLKPEDRIVLLTKSLESLLGKDLDLLYNFPIENIEDEVLARLPEAQSLPVAMIVLEDKSPTAAIEPVDVSRDPAEEELEEEKTTVKEVLGLVPVKLWSVFKSARPRSKKSLALIGAVVLVIGIAVAGYYFKNQQDQATENNFLKSIESAKQAYAKAQALGQTDTAEAKKSLDQSLQEIIHALTIKPNNPEALELKAQVENNSQSILRIYQADNIPTWLDLSLIKVDFKVDRLSHSLGRLLLLDTSQQVLVQVDLASKSNQILTGGEKLQQSEMAALNGDMAVVVNKTGLLKLDAKSGKLENIIPTDEEWGNIVDLFGYGGNIYLLDSGKNQIWKYLPIDSGYSDKRKYFSDNMSVNLSESIKMQIDSSIWILKSSGEVLKYTQGQPDNFAFTGLDKGLVSPKALFVSENTEKLYILDSGNNRLVVFGKDGSYKSQYQSASLGSFMDLVVDEKTNKAYLLDGSKIYQLDLK